MSEPSTYGPAKLSDNYIKKHRCPPSLQRIELKDSELRGLRLFITREGTRTWYLTRKVNGKTIRRRLGEHPAMAPEHARRVAMQELNGLSTTVAPSPARSPTLEQALRTTEQLKWKGRSPKALAENRRTIERYSSEWLKQRISSISALDVQQRHVAIGDKNGKTAANRWLEIIHTVYETAAKLLDYDGKNPAKAAEPFKETKRERRLTPTESKRLLETLKKHKHQHHADLVRLALFTGARRANIHNAHVDQFDLEENTWLIPAEEAKAGKEIMLPLAPQAVAVVKRRIKAAGKDGWLFPGQVEGRPITDFTKPFKAILEEAKIRNLRFHDLRRSLRSFICDAGHPDVVAKIALGQAVGGMDGIYARPMQATVRDAVTAGIKAMGGKP